MKGSDGFLDEGRDSGELDRSEPWERLGWLGARAIDGVVAGEGSSAPADAVVGSALLALRSDLCEFKGWVITLQDYCDLFFTPAWTAWTVWTAQTRGAMVFIASSTAAL